MIVVAKTISVVGLDESKLIVADSPEAIAAQILNLLENIALRKEKALLAREYIEGEFHWEAVLKDICSFIERV